MQSIKDEGIAVLLNQRTPLMTQYRLEKRETFVYEFWTAIPDIEGSPLTEIRQQDNKVIDIGRKCLKAGEIYLSRFIIC